MFSRQVFEWGSEQFSLLGVNISLNMQQMIDENYEHKILEMKNTIKQWSTRKLTVFGRITVVKTLVILKITHLLISWPNPPERTLKHINTILFKFVWQNKPDRIKRVILVQDNKKGGLKMLDIINLTTALKLY